MSQLNTILSKIPMFKTVIELEQRDKDAHRRATQAITEVNGHVRETLINLTVRAKETV